MNALAKRVFFRAASVIIAMGSVWLIGRSLGIFHEGTNAAARAHKPVNSTAAIGPSTTNSFTRLTRQQAWDRWNDWLANPGGNPPDMKGLDPQDIPYLLKMVAGFPPGASRDVAVSSLLFWLMNSDPVTAFSHLGLISNSSIRARATINIIQLLARSDPQLAMKALAKLPADENGPEIYRSAFMGWAYKDAAAAAAAAGTLPIGLERDDALAGVAQAWSLRDPTAALNWASELTPEDSAAFKAALLGVSFSARQPALAAQYVDRLANTADRDQAIQTVARDWAVGTEHGQIETDPAAALHWLDQVATGEVYDNSVKSIFSQLANDDPAVAATLINSITEPALRDATISQIAGAWGKTAPQAALAWVQALPDADGTTRDAAVLSLVKSWATSDAKAAAAFVQNSSDPTAYLSAAPAIAQSLAAYSPQAALDWTNSLPDGDTKNMALNSALTGIAKTDFTTAWNYAVNLPANDNSIAILSNLVAVDAQQNPGQAAGLLNKFSAGPEQLNATSVVAATWVLDNPAAFIQWASGLPPGSQRDTAAAAAIKATQTANLPEAERNALVQRLTQALTP